MPENGKRGGDRQDHTLGVVAADFGTSSATVTMHDSTKGRPRALGPAQSAVLAERLAAVLHKPDWPGYGALPGEQVKAKIAEIVGSELASNAPAQLSNGGWPGLAQQLADDAVQERKHAENRYREEDESNLNDRSARLDVTCAAFEQILDQNPDLVEWLAPLLHEAHRRAFNTVSLNSYELTPVLLELDTQELDVSSLLVLPANGDMTKARLQAWSDDKSVAFPGLKRYLSQPRAVELLKDSARTMGRAADTDLLIARAYRDLVERTCDFADKSKVAHLLGRRVDQLTVTYPTITPPAARRRLRALLSLELKIPSEDIDTTYDEGVAAALFFVMRQLNAESELGVEALRAGSREVQRSRSWRRTMLVVDIGGGTTDIALVTLDLEDVTPQRSPAPASAGEPDPFRGRHYRLRPSVLGTSGHSQLGGDLLTLRVFYWLKAVIADALATLDGSTAHSPTVPALAEIWPADQTSDPAPAALAPLVIGFREPGPAPRAVREALRKILPTHTAEPGHEVQTLRGGHAFRILWQAAEQAKKDLAAGKAFPLDEDMLTNLKNALDGKKCPWAAALDDLEPQRLALDPADFAVLARPMLDAAMRLAGSLARQRLSGTPDHVLDSVALAGRTCGMPVAEESAREVLSDVLRDDSARSEIVLWDPTAIAVETEYPKQAASIGACWARSRSQVMAKLTDDDLLQGKTVVDVEVDNLLLHLPCGFDVGGPEGQGTPILEPGVPLDRVRADGSLYVQSRWLVLRPDISMRRRMDGGSFIRWGRFRYSAHDRAQRERAAAAEAIRVATAGGSATPVPAPAPILPSTPPPDVYFSVQMDQELMPTLLLRRGVEDHLIINPINKPFDLSGPLRGAMHDGRLQFLPQVRAELLSGQSTPQGYGEPLFGSDGGFDSWLHPLGSTDSIRGAVSRIPLPAPPKVGLTDDAQAHRSPPRYRLCTRTGPEKWRELDEISLPHPDAVGTAGYWAALDVYGRLHVLSEPPVFLPATTLHEMEQVYGSVYFTELQDTLPDRNPSWDPFNGQH